ncbi:CAF17-like 4Fe-4S cluster assembly/insertion protein YgfZ [Terriglobus albidus]|uniref:CAF17-like 4Fe-4S cluster assembly/insertion protein YgfZ n=1 Tax=Terriglobus albidus TaxID=1592106 RepID=UPI0021DF44DF|nr:folate-binding protein [Terriglobus albidus]
MSTLAHNEAPALSVDHHLALKALLSTAAIYPLDATGWIGVRGEDRVRWLNGMLTNNIRDLKPGEGCYNFLLSAQGRIQHDATAFLLEGQILLETARERVPALMAALDHFIIMDDVELDDVSAKHQGLGIAGPKATEALAATGLNVAGMAPVSTRAFEWRGSTVWVVAQYSPLTPRFELWAENVVQLTEALNALPQADSKAIESLRIVEGIPAIGKDLREKELPQETGQTRALHFTKGCYLGQEIVERIRSRGNLHRTFAGFRFSGVVPSTGAAILADGASVGELTSVDSDLKIALGFIRREAVERGQALTYEGGALASSPLPFRIK